MYTTYISPTAAGHSGMHAAASRPKHKRCSAHPQDRHRLDTSARHCACLHHVLLGSARFQAEGSRWCAISSPMKMAACACSPCSVAMPLLLLEEEKDRTLLQQQEAYQGERPCIVQRRPQPHREPAAAGGMHSGPPAARGAPPHAERSRGAHVTPAHSQLKVDTGMAMGAAFTQSSLMPLYHRSLQQGMRVRWYACRAASFAART